MSELEKSLLHDNDNSHVDEIMDDPNNFVPVSISSPKKPSEHPNQVQSNFKSFLSIVFPLSSLSLLTQSGYLGS